jgi:hypothetical protein
MPLNSHFSCRILLYVETGTRAHIEHILIFSHKKSYRKEKFDTLLEREDQGEQFALSYFLAQESSIKANF